MSLTKGLVLAERPYVGNISPPDLFEDISRFGNNGTHYNITWVQLTSGLWVRSFNGSTSSINIGTPASLNIKGQFTCLAWVYSNAGSNDERIFDKFYLRLNFNTPTQVRVIASGLASGVMNAPISLGKWQLTYGGYDDTYLWTGADGARLEAVDSGSISDNSTTTLRIGSKYNGADNFFDGYIWGSRIYNRALSAQEIADLFESERRFFGV